MIAGFWGSLYAIGVSEPSSSVTNSPPDTILRAKKLNDKLLHDLAELDTLSARIRRHIRRSTDANLLLAQRLEICEESLKKSQTHQSHKETPKNRRSILNTGPIALTPANANRMIKKRQDVEEKKLQRLQEKHARVAEIEQQAQMARDAAEAEREARLSARYGSPGKLYLDSRGGYM